MDEFKQCKLSKNEWVHMEKPISNKEKSIMNIIKNGYDNIQIIHNQYLCIKEIIKLDHVDSDYYIYIYVLEPYIKKKYNKYIQCNIKLKKSKKTLNSADKIRLTNITTIDESIECKLLELYKKLMKSQNDKSILYYYNIYYLIKNYDINPHIKDILIQSLSKYTYKPSDVLEHSKKVIENNSIFDYKPIQLYSHQKDIYSIVKKRERFLLFYMSPTCSGKTLTPIGLSQQYKVIFICASRHIGVNLAKSAINVGVKCGFAFGCSSIKDIRLHYFSVNSYTNDKYKNPNHSDGSKLSLLISDIHSYEHAMNYLLKFSNLENIILFWDEPTISMDYDTHELHSYLKHIWSINKIPRVILSSATLPNHLEPMVDSFKEKFEDSVFYSLEVSNLENNIILVNESNEVIMPHNYFKDISSLTHFIEEKGHKYMKFLSVSECAHYILESSYLDEFNQYMITDIHSNTIKQFYYKVIQNELRQTQAKTNFSIDTQFTTHNACSITYGPALWIVENIEHYSQQLIKNSSINETILEQLRKDIDYNYELSQKVDKLQKEYQDKIAKDENNENKMKQLRFDPATKQLLNKIESLKKYYKDIQLDPLFLPNSLVHYEHWTHKKNYNDSNVFKGDVNEDYIKIIMELNVSFHYKILLLLGIGILHQNNIEYNNIMKELADSKKLMLIIASSDYIYGTNYQFAHAYLSEDLKHITQEKLIQAIGRVGRKEQNKTFTFRFRNNDYISVLFNESNSKERNKMIELFS